MKKIVLATMLAILSLQGAEVYALVNINANKEALLSTSISGVVKELRVDIGSRVKKGEILLTLDADDLIKSIDIAKAELLTLKEQYRFSSVQLERYTKVKDLISREEYERLEYDKNLKAASIIQAEANIAYKETLVAKSLLKAPFSGIISEKMVENGTVLNSGSGAIKLIDGVTKAVVEFDEKYLREVHAGNIIEFRLDGISTPYRGKLTKVYPTVDPKTRRAKAEAVINGPKPGQFGEGTIFTK